MGACWVIIIIDKTILIEKETRSKRKSLSSTQSAMVTALLDLIATIVKKSYHEESGKVSAAFDNRKV